jgi:hypothetical protein
MDSIADHSLKQVPAIAAAAAPRTPRVKVLVVLHSDGWVEIFAADNVDVAIRHRLHTEADASVNLVDEYLERSLPAAYQRLYLPQKLRAFDQCRKVTVEDEIEKRILLQVLAALREVHQHE